MNGVAAETDGQQRHKQDSPCTRSRSPSSKSLATGSRPTPWWARSTWSSCATTTGVSVLYGRCLHRGALMADGHVEGDNLICGLHDWDYRLDTGVSAYSHHEVLNEVRRLGRRRQGLGRCRRDRGLGPAAPAALRPHDLPRPVCRHRPRHARRTAQRADPALRPRRPVQDRAPRRGRSDGRAARPAAELGRHPDPARAAAPRAAARRAPGRAPRWSSAPTRRSR